MKAVLAAAVSVLSLVFLMLVFLSPKAMAMDPNLSSSRCGSLGYPFPIVGTSSHWPSVDPNKPFRQVEGTVLWSRVSHTDNPLDHKTHDWNFLVKPDSQYQGLINNNNRDNEKDPITHEVGMEMEWETGDFPSQFWPSDGDKVWTIGHYIFDCGHPSKGQYKTEIHPPVAVAFTRTEPVFFTINGLEDNAPTLASKTYIFTNGHVECVCGATGNKYEFDIPLPPKPSSDAELRTQVISLPFGGPSPILTPTPSNNPTRIHVTYSLENLTDPYISHDHDKYGAIVAAGWREPTLSQTYHKLSVTFDSVKINDDHDPGPCPTIRNPTKGCEGEWKLWVNVNGIWTDLLGGDLSNLGHDANVESGHTYNLGKTITVTVPDNEMLNIVTTGWEDDIDGYFGVSVSGALAGCALLPLGCVTTVGPLALLPPTDNDPIGVISRDGVHPKQYSSPNFGAGTPHDERSSGIDVVLFGRHFEINGGDYNLRYHINEIATFPKGTNRNPTASPPRTLPMGVEITFINSTITDLDSTNRATNASFAFGANDKQIFYPQSEDVVPTPMNVTTGKPIAFPKDLKIFTLAGNNLTVQSEFLDHGLFARQTMPPSSLEKNSIPFTRGITDVYTAQQNYGKGIHTSKSLSGSGSTDGSFNRGTIHRELFTIIYRINTTDTYVPQSSSTKYPPPDTPPETTIDSATDRSGNSIMSSHLIWDFGLPVKFSFKRTDDRGIAGFECSLNGAPFSPCSSPITYDFSQLLIMPQHNLFQVRAVDTSGNKDPTPDTFTFNLNIG